MTSVAHEQIDRAVLDRDFPLAKQLIDTIVLSHSRYEHIIHIIGHSGTLSIADLESTATEVLEADMPLADRQHLASTILWARANRIGSLNASNMAIEAGDQSFHIRLRRALAAKGLSDLKLAQSSAREAAHFAEGSMKMSIQGFAEELGALSALVYRNDEADDPNDSGALPGPTALFLKTYAGDVGRLPYLFRSIDKFVRGFNELVIVTDDGCDVGKLPTTLPVKIYDVPAPSINHRLMRGIGYWWQQALKMTWPDFSECSAAVMLDSDHVITSEMTPKSFWVDGSPVSVRMPWSRANDSNFWRLGSDYLVGQPTEYCHMCQPGPLITRPAVEGFGMYIEKELGLRPREFFVSPNNGINCSEFELFGTYIQYIDRHGYVFRDAGTFPTPIRQFQSVSGLSASQEAAIEAILA
jgi:hypothetical protein